MTVEEINKELKKPFNPSVVDELYIYLRNDSKICNNMNRELVEFGNKKIKSKQYNSTLFVQAVKLNIDNVLRTEYWQRNYAQYFDKKPSKADIYQVAKCIANYIEYDFFRGQIK